MLSREERILSEILVSRGLVARERLEACVKDRRSQSLVDALIDQGDVPREQAEAAAEEARSLEEALVPELPEGKKLGEFRLIREIGRGGMGIVYEAEQESLRRRVALKVLPAGAALDERLAIRFLREARAVGRLRHPGIVPVYTSGRADGVLYFAMEMIEGRSLAETIAAGPLDARDAARIAAEVARALEFAHQAGLVHRDVKPENILLAADGHARVLDFGLVHETSGGAFTLARHVLGTPAFIAPEQARGESVDLRSDIYGLGAVLYAMLSGAPPYPGDVPSLILTRVLAGDPADLAAAGRDLPPALVAICRKAMARDLPRRYASAAVMADDLEQFLAGSFTPAPVRKGKRWIAVSLAAALAAGGLLIVSLRARAPERPPAAQGIPASLARIALPPGRKVSPALSPSGAQLAYASNPGGRFDIYLADLAGGEPVNLTAGLPWDHMYPAFSPDGKSLAIASPGPPAAVSVMELATRTVRQLTGRDSSGLSWSADGDELFFVDHPADGPGTTSSLLKLWAVEIPTGRCRPLTGMYAGQPRASAQARRIAFVSQDGGQTDLWTIPEKGGDAVRITDDSALEWSPAWSADGSALYFGSDRDSVRRLWRIALDPLTGRPAGAAVVVGDAVFAAPFYLTGNASPALPLIVIGLASAGKLHRLAIDGGAEAALTGVAAIPDRFLAADSPQLSPDGRRLTYTAITSQEDLAIDGQDGSAARLLTQDAFHDRTPRWSFDGARIAFASDRGGGNMEIWSLRPDGTGLLRLTSSNGANATLPVWSPDGTRLAYTLEGRGAFVGPADGKLEEVVPEALAPFEPSSWSPDGRNLAGTADGIVVYSLAERRLRRLSAAGTRPVWLDNRRLLFTAARELRMVDTRDGSERVLHSFAPESVAPDIGVSRDGRSIFVSLRSDPAEAWRIDLKE